MQIPEIPIDPNEIQAIETMRVLLRLSLWLIGVLAVGGGWLIRFLFIRGEKEKDKRMELLERLLDKNKNE